MSNTVQYMTYPIIDYNDRFMLLNVYIIILIIVILMRSWLYTLYSIFLNGIFREHLEAFEPK